MGYARKDVEETRKYHKKLSDIRKELKNTV